MAKTPLYAEHEALGAKLIDFNGWHMPVSYLGVLSEHQHVRAHCGIFDVSHMGEIRVQGKDAQVFLQYVTTNDVSRLAPGRGQYTAMLNTSGGFVDDLILYALGESDFFCCVNASNLDKDFNWLNNQAGDFDVDITDQSTAFAQLAIQGPQSTDVLFNILDRDCQETIEKLKFTEIAAIKHADVQSLIARTGYTGERGYEWYIPNEQAVNAWRSLLNHEAAKPIGLGARDTLRLEACYLLYGQDMDESVSPLEAGVAWAVKFDKGNFVGRQALLAQKQNQIPRELIAFKMSDRGVPRQGMQIYTCGTSQTLGEVTSGSVLPTIGGAGGMALISRGKVRIGDKVEVDVRGKRRVASVMNRPLYLARTK